MSSPLQVKEEDFGYVATSTIAHHSAPSSDHANVSHTIILVYQERDSRKLAKSSRLF